VPDKLVTTLRDRERQSASTCGIDRNAFLLDVTSSGITQGGINHLLRVCGGAMAWIDIHIPGVRIFLQQLLLPFAQLVRILRSVRRGDAKQRFFILERICPKATVRFKSRRSLTQAAVVSRNGALS